MRVRKRKQREEGEGLAAIGAATATDPNPVVMLVVCLLAAMSVTDDRIAFTNGALAQNRFVAVLRPVGFELVQRGKKWDKENRSSWGALPPTLTCQDLSRKRSSSSSSRKIQLKEKYSPLPTALRAYFKTLAGYRPVFIK